MMVQELKEILDRVKDPEITPILLYNGFDECDVFATTAAQIDLKNYHGYCGGGSFTKDDDGCDAEKIFVIAGWGASYGSVGARSGENLYLVTNGPEGDESRKRAEEDRKQAEAKAAEQRAAAAQELDDNRTRRYCINWEDPNNKRVIQERNVNTDAEVLCVLSEINGPYVVYDRVEKKVVWRREE